MYTISLLLLVITWSPFYIMSMVQVVTSDLSTSLSLSPLVTSLATLYAPLAALLHGYRQPAVSTLKYFQSDVKFEIFLQVYKLDVLQSWKGCLIRLLSMMKTP